MIQCVGLASYAIRNQSVCAKARALQRQELNRLNPPEVSAILLAPDPHHATAAGDARRRSVGRGGQPIPGLADVDDGLRVLRDGREEVENDMPAPAQSARTHTHTLCASKMLMCSLGLKQQQEQVA